MLSTATNEPLFIALKTEADLFEKEAAGALSKMPDDEKKWPAQVLSELQRVLPFLAQYDLEIVIDRMEPEAGAALGYAQIHNKTMSRPQDDAAKAGNVIRIPIIIQDRRLQKFLVFEAGGETYPLTEDRVEQAMLNPALFDTSARRVPSSPSLVDAMYPPYQQRQGFGRVVEPDAAGLSKISSADDDHTKEARLLRKVGPWREFDGEWLAQFEDTPFYKEALAVQVADARMTADFARKRAAQEPVHTKQAALDADFAELEGTLAQWKHDNQGERHSATLSKLASARDSEAWSQCFFDSPYYTRALSLEKQAADLRIQHIKNDMSWQVEEQARAATRTAGAELEAKLAGWRLEMAGGEKVASDDSGTSPLKAGAKGALQMGTIGAGIEGLIGGAKAARSSGLRHVGKGALEGMKRNKRGIVGLAAVGGALDAAYALSNKKKAKLNPELKKAAMVALNFQKGMGLPGPQVFEKMKGKPRFKVGVIPQNYWFYPLQGTPFYMGVPKAQQKALEKETDQQKKMKMVRQMAMTEIQAGLQGRPSPGAFILVTKKGQEFKYEPPMMHMGGRPLQKAAGMLSGHRVSSGGDEKLPCEGSSEPSLSSSEKWLKAFEGTPFRAEAEALFAADQAMDVAETKRDVAQAIFRSKRDVLEAKLKLHRLAARGSLQAG